MLARAYSAVLQRGPQACWPAGLAKLVCSRFDKRSCLKNKTDMTKEDLNPPLASICMRIHTKEVKVFLSGRQVLAPKYKYSHTP